MIVRYISHAKSAFHTLNSQIILLWNYLIDNFVKEKFFFNLWMKNFSFTVNLKFSYKFNLCLGSINVEENWDSVKFSDYSISSGPK